MGHGLWGNKEINEIKDSLKSEYFMQRLSLLKLKQPYYYFNRKFQCKIPDSIFIRFKIPYSIFIHFWERGWNEGYLEWMGLIKIPQHLIQQPTWTTCTISKKFLFTFSPPSFFSVFLFLTLFFSLSISFLSTSRKTHLMPDNKRSH